MKCYSRCFTPFVIQCFAVSSVTLNMISYGMTTGYNASLFSELRRTKEILLDIDSESWLASLIGITLLIGSVISSLIMETFGRKPVIIKSSVFMICGWISFSLASTITVLLIGKLFQGLSVGFGTNVGSVLIGEYSSPKHRGSFIATIPTALLFGIFISHAFGMYFGWHDLSKILFFFSLPGLTIALFAPESPIFLAKKGRYDECRKTFRWLRGTEDDEELEKMIKKVIMIKENGKMNQSRLMIIKEKLVYLIMLFKKREFRIPVFITMHVSAIHQFCGTIVGDMYPLDIHTALYGTDVYMFKVITSLDVLRLVATVIAIYLTSRKKRRLMITIFLTLNIFLNLCISGYIYARMNNLLPEFHLYMGLVLHHFQYFIIGVGSLPLCLIIMGEIFPSADRGFCLIISKIFCSLFMFSNIKSAPYLFSIIGVHGAFCFYSFILFYCLIVTLFFLPETNNKTLQEVEDAFRG